MKTRSVRVLIFAGIICMFACEPAQKEEGFVPKPYSIEAMYDESAPQPPKVTPADFVTIAPPADAVVLFDGTGLSGWQNGNGGPAKWKVENGYMEVVKETGQIYTKQKFGSCQLHIEWASPAEVKGNSQGRGNSGVFLMNMYEVQVLDSYDNITYPPGMAAAVYAQNPPLVNASRGPGQWQSYDIIFHRPVFKDSTVIKPADVTVIQNGVLVQDHFLIQGPTDYKKVPRYRAHPDKMPLSLQDHGNPVRYRNIWIRELED